MYTEDFVKRLIRMAVEALYLIVGLRTSSRYGEALKAIDQTLEELLGLRAGLLKNLDDRAILDRLTSSQEGLDIDRLAVVADLFVEEGLVFDGLGQPERSAASHLRALNFYLEVALRGVEKFTEPVPRIEDLLNRVPAAMIPEEMQFNLFAYFEQTGRYNLAEAALDRLSEKPELYDDMRDEKAEFYRRLLDVAPARLEKGGVTRGEVLEKLSRMN